MPDLKERYSDAELDRSDKAFDELVSRPDMQALNDQGDAVARDLRDAESNPESSPGDKSPQKAEAAAGEAPDNRFNYQKQPGDKPDKGTGWSRRRKLVALGIGGGGIGGLLISLFMLLPLKVPGIMQMVTDATGQRLEQITEKRAKVIIGRAILTKFGTHTGIVITGEGAFKTLIASMRTSGFEKRLAAKGLTIATTSDGVKLTYKGTPLGNGKTFTNEQAIMDALEKDKLTNRMLKDVIKEEIPSWRWMKRAKFAKWLRIKYGIPKYGLTNSDKSDPEEKKKDMDAERVKSANERTSRNFREMLGCLMGGSCSKVDGSESASNKANESTPTADDIDGAGSAFADDVAKNGLKATTETTTKILLKTFGSKAIPVIGWIDIIATLDHFANETIGTNDYFGKIAAYYKGAAYAAVYADWAGYGSQIQGGAMDPEYVGVLSDSLNGAEKAQAFQAVEGDASKGVPVSLQVNSDKPSSVKQLFDKVRNSPVGLGNKYIGHPVLNAYYETVGSGGFLGWVSGLAGKFLGTLFGWLTPQAAKDLMAELAKETVSAIGPFILKEFGFTLDAFDRGANLMNNIFGGGVVSTNQYCKEIGCRKLSSAQAAAQDNRIALERAEYRNQKGILYALFSPQESTSLTTQLAIATPSSPASGLSTLSNTITSIPSKLASIVTPHSAAAGASYESLYGVSPYGATTADLARPLSSAFMAGDECPDVNENDFNDCTIDTEVAKAMQCEFTPESADCADTDPNSSQVTGVGGFRIASFNFLGDSHTSASVDDSARFDRSLKVIVDNAIDIVGVQEFQQPQFNRFKERATNYDIYPSTATYGDGTPSVNSIIWDKTKFKMIEGGTRPFAYFNNATYQLPYVLLSSIDGVQQFYVFNVHDPAHPENAELRYKDALAHADMLKEFKAKGKAMFFTGDFNSGYHVRTDGSGNTTYGNTRQNLTYCILTRDGTMQDAFDSYSGATGECPTAENAKATDCAKGYSSAPGNTVDHIFITKDVKVACYWRIPGGVMNNGSDVHDTVIADIAPPTSSSLEGANFRMSSFNIYYNTNESDRDYSINQWQDRLARSVGVIKNNNFDVVGLQEVRQDQWKRLQDSDRLGGTYDIYPKNYAAGGYTSQNPIVWNTEIFDLVEGKTIPGYQVLGPHDNQANTQVKLRYKKTGQEIYLINSHEPVGGGVSIKARYDSATARAQYVKELASEGKPIFLTGDFNSSYDLRSQQPTLGNNRNNMFYCVITNNNLMWDSYDASQNKTGQCPTRDRGGVDHIFMSTSVKATKYDYSITPRGNGSDVHNTLYADIQIPSTGPESGSSAGGWVWPIQKDLKPGPCWNVNVGSLGLHAGMDINTDNADNPALAMHAGTITKTGFDPYAGNYVKVNTGIGKYYIYEHLKTITKKAGLVRAGEQLGIAGKTGRLTINSKAHFHFVVSTKDDFPSYNSLQGSIDPMSVLPKPAPGGYACTR